VLAAALAVAGVMLALWALSLALSDASIVDVAWGALFVIAAWTARLAAGDAGGAAGTLALVLVTLWGLRLAVHIARRNLGHREDARYTAMRSRHPGDFWIRSLFTVFLLQGGLALLIGWPVIAAVSRQAGAIGVLGVVGALVWAVGLFFETVGDLQLERFKADPRNRGKVMDRGLWRYTRHPNYFGDACVWWGLSLVAFTTWPGILTILSPLAMTWLLAKGTGKPLLEKDMSSRRPGYADYVRRTSGFLPLPPKKHAPTGEAS
jgi:steroid 5-alpha reductase family enzyme